MGESGGEDLAYEMEVFLDPPTEIRDPVNDCSQVSHPVSCLVSDHFAAIRIVLASLSMADCWRTCLSSLERNRLTFITAGQKIS